MKNINFNHVVKQFSIGSLGVLLVLISTTLFIEGCTTSEKETQIKTNVLFIGIDDLRPELGSYGNLIIQSPNIDRLASEGIQFNQAFCQVPVCGASRASILSGLMPTRNRFINYATHIDVDAPGIVTLPAHFKNNGYHTVCLGKIFHYPTDNEALSWSEPAVRLDWKQLNDGSWSWEGWHDYMRPENVKIDKETGKGPPYEWADVPDNAYTDGKTVDMAVQKLGELKDNPSPFFLAVGILKPHLPFNAPQKYWDLYDPSQFSIPDNYGPPKNVPQEALFKWGELRAYTGVPQEGPVSDSMAINLVHGYHASISYVDALVGKLMQSLKENGLDENTIVVLWSDHGWFLGEHGLWTKHSLFELSARVPLIIKTPGKVPGLKTDAIIEMVDLYPTLSELADLEAPNHLQGKSFADVINNPNASHKKFSYIRFRAGESIKMNDLRYTKYINSEGAMISDMLYDHQLDPGENNNVVSEKKYSVKKERLNKALVTEIERIAQ